MQQQVDRCLACRGPYTTASFTLPERVKFAVAGPFDFYRDDTRTPKRRKLTDDICQIASDYASDVAGRDKLELSFGGFLVVGDENTSLSCTPVPDSRTEAVVPCFTPPIIEVPVFDDIEQVRAYVEKKD